MTNNDIQAALPGATVWDRHQKGSVTGLHVRVSAAGKKTFYLYYRTREGVQRKPKLGQYGQITLAQARSMAKEIMVRVLSGRDPVAEWKEAKSEYTVADLYQLTWDGYWDAERFHKSGWAKEVKGHWDFHLAKAFGNTKARRLTSKQIRDWHAGMKDKPYAANRSLETLSRIFNYAIEHEILPQNTNPASLIKRHPEKKRGRYATDEEIRKVGAILQREADNRPREVAFLYLLMFSGSRPRAIERATPDQLKRFEYQGRVFGILTFYGKSTAATGTEETVIIPPQAMVVLDKLPHIKDGTLTGINMPKRFWASVKKEAGCEDLWARDWRRTFASMCLADGVTDNALSELMNHSSYQTTKTYAKLRNDKRMDAVASVASKLDSLITSSETVRH